LKGTVLVPLDGSVSAERALPAALGIAVREARPLRLLHVHDPSARPPDFASMAEAEAYLGSVLDRVGPAAVTGLSADVVLGEATAVLLHEVGRAENAVIAMSTRGRGRNDGAFASARGRALLLGARPPVLAFGPAAGSTDPAADTLRPAAPANLLAALDGTPEAQSVLPHVLRIVRASGGRIILLTVLPPEESPRGGRGGLATQVGAARYLDHIAGTLGRAGAVVNQRIMRAGDVGSAILRAATEENAHAIVLTTHSNASSEPAFGTTFANVLLHAREPVLACRPGVLAN
jgi:nucleotide-binding universal stress UspA family protein